MLNPDIQEVIDFLKSEGIIATEQQLVLISVMNRTFMFRLGEGSNLYEIKVTKKGDGDFLIEGYQGYTHTFGK